MCLDARPLAEAGARWVNGVATWLLDAAQLPKPAPEQRRGDDGRFHLLAGWGPERVIMQDRGVVELDMRILVAQLHGLAQAQGAELRGGVHVHGLTGNRLDTSAGPLHADLFVDASGLAGARLAKTPVVGRQHICAAAQAVHAVDDLPAARAFFAAHEVAEGETLCFAGIAGGYSILNARLEGDEISILTGSIPARGHPSGRELLDSFVAEQAWIGVEQFGGARAIPIRRPFDRLAHGRVALLGDSGCQVFSAHGSGIGVGLLAGRMLAEALADGRGLEGYERRFLRGHGGLLAASDVFRRHSEGLTVADLQILMRSGLLDAKASAAAAAQRWPRLGLASLGAKLRALGAERENALALAAVGVRMAAVAALYRVYPVTEPGLRAWSRAVARAVGDPAPDIV